MNHYNYKSMIWSLKASTTAPAIEKWSSIWRVIAFWLLWSLHFSSLFGQRQFLGGNKFFVQYEPRFTGLYKSRVLLTVNLWIQTALIIIIKTKLQWTMIYLRLVSCNSVAGVFKYNNKHHKRVNRTVITFTDSITMRHWYRGGHNNVPV